MWEIFTLRGKTRTEAWDAVRDVPVYIRVDEMKCREYDGTVSILRMRRFGHACAALRSWRFAALTEIS